MKLLQLFLAGCCCGTFTMAAEPGCPDATDIRPSMLVGRWQIHWTGGTRHRGEVPWTLTLAPHPEYEGSLKGSLTRGGEHRLIVADWDDEVLTMEESHDGLRISATWQATATEGQCGREFQGSRLTDSLPGVDAQRFRMRSMSPR